MQVRPQVLLALALAVAMPGALHAQGAPPWVAQAGMDPDHPAPQFLTGYGLSGPGGTGAAQLQQATAMAREAVASAIRTRVTSEFTSRVTQVDQTMARFVQNLVLTRADLELEGLDTFLSWRDERKGVTHVLAVLDKAACLRLLTGRVAKEAAQCGQTFASALKTRDAEMLLQARHLRERIEESLVVASVLSGGSFQAPPCPSLVDLDAGLRRAYADVKGLEGTVALAALDLGQGLPRGLRVLMDRVTYADTPFCGTFSGYLEQALANRLTAFGQVRVVDRAAGRDALQGGVPGGNFAEALHAQAVVRGTCFELDGQVKLHLRATSVTGEDLSAASLTFPSDVLRRAGLGLAPDNLQEASQELALARATVQSSTLRVSLALDRGEGGIYRKGDKIFLFLRASQDCYVKVLYQQVDGRKLIIFPNEWHPEPRIRKDQLYQLPPDDNSFTLEANAPYGAELVKVMASTEPIDIPVTEDGTGLGEVREALAGLLTRTRGITLRKADAKYAEDTVVLNTLPPEPWKPTVR